MGYKTKAELAFEAKADAALRRGDYAHAEQVATWYDGYLRLVAPDTEQSWEGAAIRPLTVDDSRAIAACLLAALGVTECGSPWG